MAVASTMAPLWCFLAALVACVVGTDDVTFSGEVKVGILHSLTGTMAISEQTVVNAELMAISEINAAGGVIGRRIVPVIEDGESDWPTFAAKAEIFTNPTSPDRVEAVFGCWTSASRKEVLPVFERNDHMLFYPVQYEGQECSKNIFYTGATPNQQIEPAVDWLLRYKSKRFFLVGSDYVFPRTANDIIRNQLAALGGVTVDEMYLPLGEKSDEEVGAIINSILTNMPDGGVIFNTLNGDSNVKFFHMFYDAGLRADTHPIMSVSITETEIDVIGVQYLIGHYAAWNFFMSLKDAQPCPGAFDPTQAIGFVQRYQAMYGNESLVNDPMEAAYIAVLLWAEAVELAGTFEIDIVRETLIGMAVGAPEGEVTMRENHHITKFVRLGEVTPTGEFSIFYESTRAVHPEPWNFFVASTSGYACDWSPGGGGGFYPLDTVDVALVHDLSGPNAAQDRQFLEAEIATIRQVNREGGVNGRTIMFTVHDTAGDEAAASTIISNLFTAEERPVVIFGSEPSDAVYEAAMQGIDFGDVSPPLLVNPRFSEGGHCSEDVLHVGGSLRQRLEPALAVFIQRSEAARRPEAAFYIVGSLPATEMEEIRGHVTEAGGVIKGVTRVLNLQEVTDLPATIEQAMPDGGTIINIMSDLAYVLPLLDGLIASGMGAGRYPVFLTNFAESDLSIAGERIANQWVASPYFQAEESAQNTIFLDVIRQAYGRDYAVSDRTASAYMGIRYWASAAILAGEFGSKAIQRVMWTQEIQTLDGLVQLTASNYIPRSFRLGTANEGLTAFRIFQVQTVTQLEPGHDWLHPDMEICDFSRSLMLVCVVGQGLVGAGGSHTNSTADAVGCDWCPQGTFSQSFPRPGDLPTRVCQPCARGSKQGTPGQEECLACEEGAFAERQGQTACERCGIGRYQDRSGMSTCEECEAPMTTRLFGAAASSECGCPAGMYFDNPCTACGDGMECSEFNQSVPFQVAGWYIENNTGFAVWRCQTADECPVGPPGTCKENRNLDKPACALCNDGYKAETDGGCSECSIDFSIMLMPLTVFFGTVGLIVVHIGVNFPRAKTSAKSLSAGILGGLAVNAVLNFNVYQGTSDIWASPLQDFFAVMQIFRMDLNAMNFSCLSGSNDPVLRYAGELMVPIMAALAMVIGSSLVKCCCVPRSKSEHIKLTRIAFLNTYGGILSVFFISVSMLTFKPFKCVEHPSGIESLESNRAIRCWETTDGHQSMVTLALAAILVYPVFFMALTGYLTLMYRRCLQKYGSTFMEYTRFLFNRFSPDRYYFGFLFNARGMLLALVPVIFSASFGLKMFAIMGIFLFWMWLQMKQNPWRFPLANIFDSLLSPIQLMTVLCFALIGPAVSVDNAVESYDLGMMVIIFCLLSITSLFIAGLVKLVERLQGRRYWTFFLSHHKVACGLYARQVKLMIQEAVPSSNIFLDVDNLENLDSLVFTVSSNTENMVVLLTSETMKRFWCAVEIAISHVNKVNLVLVNAEPNAAHDAHELVELIPDLWVDTEWTEFLECGVQKKDIVAGYKHLLSLSPISMTMQADTKVQVSGCARLVELCNSLPRQLRTMSVPVVDRTCCIVYDTLNVQQHCVSRILDLLLERSGWSVELMKGHAMPDFTHDWVFFIMLSSGFFQNPISAGLLTLASKCGLIMVPVLNQATYVKPDSDFLEAVVKGTAFDEKDHLLIQRVAPGCRPMDMYEAFSNIGKKIALKFSPEANEEMMKLELKRILARTHMTPEVAWLADV